MPNTSIWAASPTYLVPSQTDGLFSVSRMYSAYSGKRPFAISSSKPAITYTSRPGRVLTACKARKNNYNTSLHPYPLRSFVTTILCQSASKSVLSPLSNGLNGVFSTHLLAKTAVFHQPSRHFHANPQKTKRPGRYQPRRLTNHQLQHINHLYHHHRHLLSCHLDGKPGSYSGH